MKEDARQISEQFLYKLLFFLHAFNLVACAFLFPPVVFLFVSYVSYVYENISKNRIIIKKTQNKIKMVPFIQQNLRTNKCV